MAVHLRQPPFSDELPHPVYIRSEKLESDSTYPRHSHGWGEFVYSFSGVMEVKLAQRSYLAPPHYGIWLPPEVEHTGSNRFEAWFCSLYLSRELCAGLPADTCTLAVGPVITSILADLTARKVDYPRGAEDARLVQVLIDQLGLAPRHDSYLPMSDDPTLGQVLAELRKTPSDKRSLEAWARAVHSTERTLSRRCQRDLGMSFSEWRQRLRLVSALPMLDARMPVQSVALELGYSTSSAFIAMFHRMLGITPEEFRKRSRGA
ncbi:MULTISPECIES: AraC family transcriptional regulator [unclassified Janthinobacterium]|uniref:AraC family transcriptional regulator n=1 Tax=unclassified Janthinobacterium TaxID=2610881 RepID=UPI0003453812|nr:MULTISPECIES: helix-turn-helix transcriptional regulator [unclassified Janthinobacterium]MEC5159638.1 AraC-like DNA-binding protein [Janthinobacterium sp. CG_S6]